jgi:3-oxoacyl-[acyl-carrier protein] reductase
MGKLSGKVAIVTGASKGIGAAVARSLAADGASVVVNYGSSKEGAQKVVGAIVAKGGEAIAVKGDVSNAADARAVVDAAIGTYGRLDVLVNNAGIYDLKPLDEITEQHFHAIFDTDVLGVLLVSREAAKHLGKGGSIVNIGSAVSRITPPGSAVYTAAKAAVDAITGVLSRELGPKGVRVNSVNPGMVETEGTQTAGIIGSSFQDWAIANTPLGRIGQPEDIASVAAFLATEDAGWLTGQQLIASGGMQ